MPITVQPQFITRIRPTPSPYKKKLRQLGITAGAVAQYVGLTRSYRVVKLKEHIENVDPNVSLKALDQSWKLDGAYSEQHHHVITRGDYEHSKAELEELEKEEERLKKELADG